MRFQITLTSETFHAHSSVFVQDEMIYRIKTGKIGGQLQKARTCCWVHHSSCQGNFCSFHTVVRHCCIQGREIIEKVGGRLATQPAWRSWSFWQGTSTPKADRVLERCSRKQSRETALTLQWGSSCPRSKPAPERQPFRTECPFWNIQCWGRDWTGATALPPTTNGFHAKMFMDREP